MDYGLEPGDMLELYPPDKEDMAPNFRWQAPEILQKGVSGVPGSKEADIFAFGMVAVEVSTGKVLWEKCRKSLVAFMIMRGERPELSGDSKVVNLTNRMQELLEECWKSSPQDRPNIEEVVEELQAVEKLQALKKLQAVEKLEVSPRPVVKQRDKESAGAPSGWHLP